MFEKWSRKMKIQINIQLKNDAKKARKSPTSIKLTLKKWRKCLHVFVIKLSYLLKWYILCKIRLYYAFTQTFVTSFFKFIEIDCLEVQVFHSERYSHRVKMFSDFIDIQCKSNPQQKLTLSTIWLRDHCRCKDCFNQKTKQRILDLTKLPKDLKVSRICEKTDDQLLIECKFHSIYICQYLKRNFICRVWRTWLWVFIRVALDVTSSKFSSQDRKETVD